MTISRTLAQLALAALLGTLGSACQTATAEDIESVHVTRSAVVGGIPAWGSDTTTTRVVGQIFGLAGRDLNGVALNGKALDGHLLVSVALNSAVVSGAPVKSVALTESVFTGRGKDGKTLKAAQWVGAEFTGLLDDGESLVLRIDERIVSKEKTERDVVRYVVSYPTVDGRKSLCGEDQDGNPVAAIPLEGRWDYRAGVDGGGSKIDDPTSFTFACEGYVLAKCVNMGYHPWWPVMTCTKGVGCTKTTLASYHQACTRMLRADYCGNGLSHTVDGTAVNVYDGVGVRNDTESWALEAEWSEAGAKCASIERISEPSLPSCWATLALADCGDKAHFTSGTLLISEVQPPQ